MIEYKNAVFEDIDSLKILWINTFEDTKIAVDLFFERIFEPGNTFVVKTDEQIVSMLYLLPTSVNGEKACYLYAAATNEQFRGQGIMGSLIDYALSTTDCQVCVTLPGSESLYKFYSKFGFENLSCNVAKLSRKEMIELAKPYQLQDLIVNNYTGIRNRVLKNNFLFWNNKHINYSFEYNEIYGAKIIKSNFGYAIAYENDGICYVSEIICHDDNAGCLITDILSEFECEEFVFHLSPEQKFLESQPEKFGMVKFFSDYKTDNIYCGLTLD